MLFCGFAGCIYRTSVFRPAKNFHEIDPGKFYRSAQLVKEEFVDVVQQYGIKTVINLRGSQPGEWWFDEEEATLRQLGVRLESIGFSTEQLQTKEDWKRYVELIGSAPRPILVHCRSGADRTGEATAIYMIDHMGVDHTEALKQVSLNYLHVSMLLPAKRLFVANYEGHDWLLNGYDPCEEKFRAFARDESNCASRIKKL